MKRVPVCPASRPQPSCSKRRFNNSSSRKGSSEGGGRGRRNPLSSPSGGAAPQLRGGSPLPQGELSRVGPRTGLGIQSQRPALQGEAPGSRHFTDTSPTSLFTLSEQRESHIRYRLKVSAPNWLSSFKSELWPLASVI